MQEVRGNSTNKECTGIMQKIDLGKPEEKILIMLFLFRYVFFCMIDERKIVQIRHVGSKRKQYKKECTRNNEEKRLTRKT